jgi:DNA-directed RNA polymerase specialized sigma24 family protein
MFDVTQILARIDDGDASAADELLPLVYDELRRVAERQMASEKLGHTLNATALVHEAYLRLAGATRPQRWDGRNHFFAAAAESMRRILVERARRKRRVRHGGDLQRVDFNEAALPGWSDSDDDAKCRASLSEPLIALGLTRGLGCTPACRMRRRPNKLALFQILDGSFRAPTSHIFSASTRGGSLWRTWRN